MDSIPLRGVSHNPKKRRITVSDHGSMAGLTGDLRRSGYYVYYLTPSGKWLPYDAHAHRNERTIMAALPPIIKCSNCKRYVFMHREIGHSPWAAPELFENEATTSVCDKCGIQLAPAGLSPGGKVWFSFGEHHERFVGAIHSFNAANNQLLLQLPLRPVGPHASIEARDVRKVLGRYRKFWTLTKQDGKALLAVMCDGDSRQPHITSQTAINVGTIVHELYYNYVVLYDGDEHLMYDLPEGVNRQIRIIPAYLKTAGL